VSATIRKLRADDEALALLREIRDLLKRAEQRKQSPAAVPALIAALEERYGPEVAPLRSVRCSRGCAKSKWSPSSEARVSTGCGASTCAARSA
jgi:hypothetical protein